LFKPTNNAADLAVEDGHTRLHSSPITLCR
jgi:hypothetical protein